MTAVAQYRADVGPMLGRYAFLFYIQRFQYVGPMLARYLPEKLNHRNLKMISIYRTDVGTISEFLVNSLLFIRHRPVVVPISVIFADITLLSRHRPDVVLLAGFSHIKFSNPCKAPKYVAFEIINVLS